MTRARWSGLALAVALLVGGCSGRPAAGEAVVETCERSGQRCRIAGSKVGICTATADGSLTCQDQH
ncbi:MAG: hypothetical protein KC635_28460 [Myxococcales bacterium]|nr:hypothetical protein [Myxococcales bacterium]MCB9735192.1 hypothetical protein [Deltaproteobacteria bacterium]